MKPVVIQLNVRGKRVYAELREGPTRAPGMSDAPGFYLDVNGKPYSLLNLPRLSEGIVRECGQHLSRGIARTRPIRQVLERISGAANDHEFPLFLELGHPSLENFPWEALWHERMEFLSLHPSASVVRIPSYVNNEVSTERAIEPRLRILAVLSAAGLTARSEWESLYQILGQSGNRVRIKVILSEPDLERHITSLGDSRISVEWLTDSATSLLNTVTMFQPNIVHFFCHGESDTPRLELFTRSGRPLELSPMDLSNLATINSLWLVTLNCCKSGRSSARFYSMARDLLDRGVCAVVAMKERVDTGDASLFTEHFYGTMVAQLLPLLPMSEQVSGYKARLPEVAFLKAMRFARQSLHQKGNGDRRAPATRPDDSSEWTLPVLYLRRPFITLKGRTETNPTSPAVIATLGQLVALRKAAEALREAQGPEAVLAQVALKIAELEGLLPIQS